METKDRDAGKSVRVCTCAHKYNSARMCTFPLAWFFETHRLCRRAYSVHAAVLVHFPVYPTPPSPGWSRGRIDLRARLSRASLFPHNPLSFVLSKISKSMTRRGRFCLNSELPFSLGGFPLRCWWNLTTRELLGTPLSVTATSATLRRYFRSF